MRPLKFSISVALLPFAFPFVPSYSILYITSLPINSQDTQAFFAHSDNSQLISLATYWLRPSENFEKRWDLKLIPKTNKISKSVKKFADQRFSRYMYHPSPLLLYHLWHNGFHATIPYHWATETLLYWAHVLHTVRINNIESGIHINEMRNRLILNF